MKKTLYSRIFSNVMANGGNEEYSPQLKRNADEYFNDQYDKLVKDCDKIFAILMGFQWLFSVGLALILTPFTYDGVVRSVHFHVWLALFGGAALALFPIYLYFKQPGAVLNRYVNVIAQGLFSALLIDITGGRIETHFHVFGSLAFFAFYRDLRVLFVGTAVVALDHLIRGIFFAESVYGVPDPTHLRWLEHAAWVVFEDLFLAYSCIRSRFEMQLVSIKRAEIVEQKEKVEELVADRTGELLSERNDMKIILNNVEQGIFTIEGNASIAVQCSAACEKIFSRDIRSLHVVEIFGEDRAMWDDLFEMVFDETKNTNSLIDLLPKQLNYQTKNLKLEYKVTHEKSKIKSVLCVVSDMTLIDELETRNIIEINKNAALIKVLSNKNDFIEAIEITESLKKYSGDHEEIKRKVHTLKGAFAFLDCRWLAEICHAWEGQLQSADNFEIVVKNAYENLKNELEKFILANAKVLKINSDIQFVQVELASFLKALRYVATFNPDPKIYDALDDLMLVPIDEELNWLSEAFVGFGEGLGKKINPIIFDKNDKIPAKIYRDLFRSFIHIVRNSADHGIENIQDRIKNNKPLAGQMSVKLHDEGGEYYLEFKDDGQGLNFEKLKDLLRIKNIEVPPLDEKLIDILFSDGFSTKEHITESSGRGVGLGAVRAEAKKLGGNAYAVSELGKGFTIRVHFKKIRFSQLAFETTQFKAA
jgi:HPt (histidine-containing phosphotransfer) domain-containing protein